MSKFRSFVFFSLSFFISLACASFALLKEMEREREGGRARERERVCYIILPGVETFEYYRYGKLLNLIFLFFGRHCILYLL